MQVVDDLDAVEPQVAGAARLVRERHRLERQMYEKLVVRRHAEWLVRMAAYADDPGTREQFLEEEVAHHPGEPAYEVQMSLFGAFDLPETDREIDLQRLVARLATDCLGAAEGDMSRASAWAREIGTVITEWAWAGVDTRTTTTPVSWAQLEAVARGCLELLASDVPPVRVVEAARQAGTVRSVWLQTNRRAHQASPPLEPQGGSSLAPAA